MPILLNLERVIDGNTFDNFIVIIIHSLIFGGISKASVTNKVVYFGFDGVIIFQGLTLEKLPQNTTNAFAIMCN